MPARQYDAFDLGIITTDVFGAADVLYEQTLPAVRSTLTLAPAGQPHVPVVTGFLGRGATTGVYLLLHMPFCLRRAHMNAFVFCISLCRFPRPYCIVQSWKTCTAFEAMPEILFMPWCLLLPLFMGQDCTIQ